MDLLPLSLAFLPLSPFSFPCILSLGLCPSYFVSKFFSQSPLLLSFLTCLTSCLWLLVSRLLPWAIPLTPLSPPVHYRPACSEGSLVTPPIREKAWIYKCTMPGLLALWSSWQMAVNIYNITEAGNFNSWQMGTSCQGNGYGKDKTGRQPVHLL